MKIMITGANGFIGSSLAIRLVKDGHQVIGLIRETSNLERLKNYIKDITLVYCNENIRKIIFEQHKIDVIIHAATNYGQSEKSAISIINSNVLLPIKLLSLALEFKIPKFVNLDTFFNSLNSNYEHLNSYTLSKKHFQEWGKLISNKSPIAFINLRLFHVYGPNDNETKFVMNLIENCIAGKEIDMTKGTQKRDFINIDDVVEAIIIMITKNFLPGFHHFDVGSGVGTSIKNFSIKVNRLCGGNAKINFGKLPTRNGEFKNYTACIKDLKLLGWSPKIGLDDGIMKILNSSLNKL